MSNSRGLRLPFLFITLKLKIIMEKPDNWLQDPHMSEVKLVYQSQSQSDNKPILKHPIDVFKYLISIWDMDRIELQEEFCLLLLNNELRCTGWHRLSTGGKNATVVDISLLLIVAALGNAHSVIIAHNHPSGRLKPSHADISLTKRIYKSLNIVGITLNDHLIIHRDDYYSFSQHRLLDKISKL
ncbi:MAG: JAB domain-containing protein [Balneolaceae bacterium]